jgi:RNA polymerase sigma-70 factor (ECF subfamily)
MTGNRAIGEELAQEALARLIREAGVLRPAGSLKGWLWTVATNLGRDHLRHRRFELASAPAAARSAETSGADPLETQELKDTVQAVLAHLPEPDRLCLLMKDVEELPYGILAEVLAISPETARVRVHRARERFRDLYKPLDGDKELRHASA